MDNGRGQERSGEHDQLRIYRASKETGERA